MGKKKPKFGPSAEQMLEANSGLRKTRSPIAFTQQCTSPQKRRQFTHRTDVINGNVNHAQQISRAFADKYSALGWHVTVSPVF
jgi:hypothetical protein